MVPDETGGEAPSDLVAAVLTDPSVGRGRLPSLLGLLDVGDRQVRLGALMACLATVDHHQDLAPALCCRLLDRLDGAGALEVRLALAYLREAHPDAYTEALSVVEEAAEARERVASLDVDFGGPRLGDRTSRADMVGRTSDPSIASSDGPPAVISKDLAAQAESWAESDDVPADETDAASQPDADAPSEESTGTMGDPRGAGDLAGDRDWVRVIEYASPFDRLSVLSPRMPWRYGDAYRCMGTVGRDSVPVALRVLDDPTSETEQDAFLADLARRLDDWLAASSLDCVLPLYDWGFEPVLWATTTHADETLADRGAMSLDEALWQAAEISQTVAALHERGVVHAGLDPGAVVHLGNELEVDARQRPILDTVGLLQAYRHVRNPATSLDPRYAAPEFFDRSYGRIDHATDIYHLGALCYRLVTGEAPFAGDFTTVRERVLSASPPRPSEVADVPPALDDIVATAMGKRKLARYETASQVTAQLRALRDREGADAG